MNEAGRSILIVDDEPGVAEFIGDVATGCGLDVTICHSVQAFRGCYPSLTPDVLVVDLNLADGDGIEILRYLAEKACKAKILLVSGTDMSVLKTASKLGSVQGLTICGTLNKPIPLAELEAVLQDTADGSVTTVPCQPTDLAFDEEELRHAIEDDQMEAYYQPKIALTGQGAGQIEAIEALVRWRHPSHGIIAPNHFIPLAEKGGLIGMLTEKMIDTALRKLLEWKQYDSSLSMAVNLSPALLNRLDIPDNLAAQLQPLGISPAQLCLEITESGLLEEKPEIMDILSRLRIKGFHLSIDDIGTGYSSLLQLYQMPFNEVKIDRAFVKDLGIDAKATPIIRSIINMAHEMNLRVCAEGVETEAALAELQVLGCDSVQGYFFSRPLPAGEIRDFLMNWLVLPIRMSAKG
ncbi:MAG: EAL domain-containing response regulator [Alphaproteobacteria bacterium]|nr:EAL domain-containing response regulator [Alphaproteobacteria bacterium]